ncbi:hypothetical protein [Kribbella lupini]|uniref:Uncharacterized protein n=1 Tax=Kribbella lupini TaxID=291602 RepID=A0ABN2BAB5_9ACTN
MNDDELITLLRSEPGRSDPLDPATVISGARRRRRARMVGAGAVASFAVAVAAGAGVVLGGNQTHEVPIGPPAVASTPPPPVLTPSARFTFRNTRPPIGTVPAKGEVPMAEHLSFATKGTQWAVISRVPGEPAYEPFGWRRTVGNTNLGDGTAMGIQSAGGVSSSVFRSSRVSTVVYTRGREAWYGKVNRLATIPGWVAVWADLTTAEEPGGQVSVFAYAADGTLIAQFPGGGQPPLVR